MLSQRLGAELVLYPGQIIKNNNKILFSNISHKLITIFIEIVCHARSQKLFVLLVNHSVILCVLAFSLSSQ